MYKKKNSENFLAILLDKKDKLKEKGDESKFKFFDLEIEKETDELLVDLNSKYFYCLSYENPISKIKPQKRKRSKEKSLLVFPDLINPKPVSNHVMNSSQIKK